MSVRNGLLALLDEGPSHGYQLKTAFEERTGEAWMVNIGQIYTTLQRLERDGLVAAAVGDDDAGRHPYRLTGAGRAALGEWFDTPVVASPPPRDELAVKVLLAVAATDVDVGAVIQRQRTAAVEQLQAYTRQKASIDPVADLPLALLLDSLVLKTEAEIRWLDACEARIARARDAATPTEGSSR